MNLSNNSESNQFPTTWSREGTLRQTSATSSREGTLNKAKQPRSGNIAMNNIKHACSLGDNHSMSHCMIPPPPPPTYSLASAYENWTKRTESSVPGTPLLHNHISPSNEHSSSSQSADCFHSKNMCSSPLAQSDTDNIDEENVDINLTQKSVGDWRRSAVFTIFLFPPTGLLAMAAALMSHSKTKLGKLRSAKIYAHISCTCVFISLVFCIAFILLMVFLRVYRVIDNPFQ